MKRTSRSLINWGRAAAIFDNPQPPEEIWERQFDYADEDLQRIARTPYKKFDFADLWYYLHDLKYQKLQPELFAYLFPICLMDWHQSLQQNTPCSHGDAEFHCSLNRGRTLDSMVSSEQREAIINFLRDSFLERLDAECGFRLISFYGWLGRFNSVAMVLPCIERLWQAWWAFDTPGCAVAAIEYCSQLMYFAWENPLFTEQRAPGLWENDSLDPGNWLESNFVFLRTTLTAEYVEEGLQRATEKLRDEPELQKAQQLLADWTRCRPLFDSRSQELFHVLEDRDAAPFGEWSV